jgi:hypothetical protein
MGMVLYCEGRARTETADYGILVGTGPVVRPIGMHCLRR